MKNLKLLPIRLVAVALVFANLFLFILIFPPCAAWFIATGKDISGKVRPFRLLE